MSGSRLPNSVILTTFKDPCMLYFEPWGAEYELLPSDVVTVQTDAFKSGQVEISYSVGSIVLAFTEDVEINVTNGNGQRIPV